MSLPFATLVDLLHERAQRQPDQMAYTFLVDALADGEDASLTLSYAELDTQARAIAAHLQQRTNRGDRALLAYPSGLPFLAALFGCLYADVIPVPTSIPYHQRPDIRFQSIVADAKPVSVLTEASILPLIQTQVQKAATTTAPWCLSTFSRNTRTTYGSRARSEALAASSSAWYETVPPAASSVRMPTSCLSVTSA